MSTADLLRQRIRPHAEKLVDAIVERIIAEYDGVTDRALELAVQALQLELEDLHARPEVKAEEDAAARPARSPRGKAARRALPAPARVRNGAARAGGAAGRRDRGGAGEGARSVAVGAAQPGVGHACRICKRPGHNARTCKDGRGVAKVAASDDEEGGAAVPTVVHQPAVEPVIVGLSLAATLEAYMPPELADDEDAPAPRRRGRPRKTEATAIADPGERPTISHERLVARLAADRANNHVGDAGGFVPRAEVSASLVGHTEEKREFCPTHGWVGRVAFERDGHQHCQSALGDPCGACNGRGFATTGSLPCNHCDGTGIEPQIEEVPSAPAAASTVPPPPDDLEQSDRVFTGTRRRPRWSESHVRPKTTATNKLTRAVLREGALALEELDADLGPFVPPARPRTRGECVDDERPCPWVSCRHHLYLEVDPERGSIKINFPDLEPWELKHTCALDLAETGRDDHVVDSSFNMTLEEVALTLNLTRERVRQIESKGLRLAHAVARGHFRLTASDASFSPKPDEDAA